MFIDESEVKFAFSFWLSFQKVLGHRLATFWACFSDTHLEHSICIDFVLFSRWKIQIHTNVVCEVKFSGLCSFIWQLNIIYGRFAGYSFFFLSQISVFVCVNMARYVFLFHCFHIYLFFLHILQSEKEIQAVGAFELDSILIQTCIVLHIKYSLSDAPKG